MDNDESSPVVPIRRRSKMRRPPPIKLGWPASSQSCVVDLTDSPQSRTQSTASSSPEVPVAVAKGNKRKVVTVVDKKRPPQELLWTDLYQPNKVEDVALAPKKIRQLETWFEEIKKEPSQQQPRNRLLILVGAPGIGKSTAIRLLADQMGYRIHEWTESVSTARHARGSWSYYGSIDQQSPMHALEQFLLQAAVGYSPLKSSQNALDESSKHKRIKRDALSTLILLDELPYTHSAEAAARLKEALTRHVQTTSVPTVWIYSQVVEGKHNPVDLEALLESETLYSQAVQIVTVPSPTDSRTARALTRILQLEFGAKRPQSTATTLIQDLVQRASGDVRWATTTLQFSLAGGGGGTASGAGAPTGRDAKLTAFHALGKLLYAKRTKPVAAGGVTIFGGEERPPLEFDPEDVVSKSDMTLDGVLQFLQYHSLDFYTDVEEVSQAWELYSDAATLLDQDGDDENHYSFRRDGTSRQGAAASLTACAVAATNLHPAPTRFRQFCAPKIYEIYRHRRDNAHQLHQVYRRVSSTSAVRGFSAQQDLTYLRILVPSVRLAMDGMASQCRASATRQETTEVQPPSPEEQALIDTIQDSED